MPGDRARSSPSSSSCSSPAGASRAVHARSGALDAYFPAETLEVPAGAEATAVETTILWNVPGEGHHPISDAIEQSIEDAQHVIHIVNPYIADRELLTRLLAAAQRGVETRIVVPGKPTPPYPAAAFRHHYERLLDAGATILLHPDMAHAKVLRIDDRVLIGGCNLDDLSLFRNAELDLLFDSPAVADQTERQVFDELVSMSEPVVVPTRPAREGLERRDGPDLAHPVTAPRAGRAAWSTGRVDR